MTEHKGFYTLTSKLLAVVCIALAVSLIVFWLVGVIGTEVIHSWLLSDLAVEARLQKEVDSFRSFVVEQRLHSTDIEKIGEWNRGHKFIQLTITGLNTTVKSDAGGAELVANEYGFVIRSGQNIAYQEYPVNFQDGVYPTTIYDRSQVMFEATINWISLLLACLVFLMIILLYDQGVTHTVQTLSRQVRIISQGNLNMQIEPFSHDEIGQLALDVDAMRLSIIDKLQREEEAWMANTQLITAISHDVRTPLTALIGYLEILSDDTIPQEQRQAYLAICKNNAMRLKSLTDELFGFFLVFGKPSPDKNLEDVNGATLLDQILLEHEMTLSQQGYDLRILHVGEEIGIISVDVGHMRRIFDNIFSNVVKYADETQPVNILIEQEQGKLTVSVSNHIKTMTNRVESNRIGLQTCEKLVYAMGGIFSQTREKDIFTVEMEFPQKKV